MSSTAKPLYGVYELVKISSVLLRRRNTVDSFGVKGEWRLFIPGVVSVWVGKHTTDGFLYVWIVPLCWVDWDDHPDNQQATVVVRSKQDGRELARAELPWRQIPEGGLQVKFGHVSEYPRWIVVEIRFPDVSFALEDSEEPQGHVAMLLLALALLVGFALILRRVFRR